MSNFAALVIVVGAAASVGFIADLIGYDVEKEDSPGEEKEESQEGIQELIQEAEKAKTKQGSKISHK